MERIKVENGAGRISVIFDPKMGLVTYEPRGVDENSGSKFPEFDGFHRQLDGGETYYKSRSEMSAAGWLPATFGRKRIAEYRTDVAIPAGLVDLQRFSTPLFGYRVMVPVSYRNRDLDTTYPVVIANDFGDIVALVATHELREFLLGGENLLMEEKEFTFSWWNYHEAQNEKRSIQLRISSSVNRRSARQIVRHSLRKSMISLDALELIRGRNRYQQALGLLEDGSDIFVVRRNILTKQYDREELTSENLREIIPSCTTILGDGELGSPALLEEHGTFHVLFPTGDTREIPGDRAFRLITGYEWVPSLEEMPMGENDYSPTD